MHPATLQFCNNGKPTWNKICDASNNTNVYHLGDTGPAGGKVFYLSDNRGVHGLEAAPVDQSSSPWGCTYTIVSGKDGSSYQVPYLAGAFGTDIGTGAANTAIMIAACSNSNTAANVASSYTLNGYHDWFLPSRDELNLMYIQNIINNSNGSSLWWSSSEEAYSVNGGINAWVGPVVGKDKLGGGYYEQKQSTYLVRAIRAF